MYILQPYEEISHNRGFYIYNASDMDTLLEVLIVKNVEYSLTITVLCLLLIALYSIIVFE